MSDNDTHKQVVQQPSDGSESIQSGTTVIHPFSGLEVGIDRASFAPEAICHHGKSFGFLDDEKRQPEPRR